jgi:predicted metal-binding membrane protein
MLMRHEAPPTRAALYWPWLLVAVAWILVLLAIWSHQTYLITHEYLLERSGLAWPVALLLFLGLWQVMTLAMMVPSTLPILAHATQPERRWPAVALFLVGYAAVWTAFAVFAFTGDTLIHWSVDHGTWLSAHIPVIGASTLALAGVFLFTPLKRLALAACQLPLGATPDAQRPTMSDSWRLGARHGLCCMGSGWALMLVMCGLEMGSLAGVAALTGLMVVEKNWPGGRRLIPAVGIILLLMAAVWLIHPAWLPPTSI